jgi:hypothetical protein
MRPECRHHRERLGARAGDAGVEPHEPQRGGDQVRDRGLAIGNKDTPIRLIL